MFSLLSDDTFFNRSYRISHLVTIVGAASAPYLVVIDTFIQRSMLHAWLRHYLGKRRKSSPPRILLAPGARRNASHPSAAEHHVRPCIHPSQVLQRVG